MFFTSPFIRNVLVYHYSNKIGSDFEPVLDVCRCPKRVLYRCQNIWLHSKIDSVNPALKELILTLNQWTYGPNLHSVKVTLNIVLNFQS